MLLAPDKFKGCLTATEVCVAIRDGLLSRSHIDAVLRPVADGGEGTLEAGLAAGFELRDVAAADALAQPGSARIGVRDRTALIELAEICGLTHRPGDDLHPLESTTYGVGLAMKAAIELGCRDLVVGLGGSASTDGGMGAAAALGAIIRDRHGRAVQPCGASLASVASVDLGPMLALVQGVSIVLASDVRSPLTGPAGAAFVFSPQKGATPDQVRALDTGLVHWANQLRAATGVDVGTLPGSGAAGGFAAPLLASRAARVVSGAQFVLDLIAASQAIDDADVVITGEGKWDNQTSAGKAPHVVVEAAHRAGKPIIAVAGSFTADATLAGISASYSLTDIAGPGRDPFGDARILLREIGTRIAADLMSEGT